MPSSEPDFTHRVAPADLLEWLDGPRALDEMRACMKGLRWVNTLTLGARPTLAWLEQIVASNRRERLRIVDVGCGSGDMLVRIERWAKRRGLPVELIGIDLCAEIIEVAREVTPPSSRIQWIVGDAFTYSEPFDVALSALLTHHLEEPEIVRFLAWMETNAQHGWFINDLVRERTPYRIFGLAGRLLRWHPHVRHDGSVSFRRALREDDWQRMLSAAGIAADQVELRRWTPGRLCVSRARA